MKLGFAVLLIALATQATCQGDLPDDIDDLGSQFTDVLQKIYDEADTSADEDVEDDLREIKQRLQRLERNQSGDLDELREKVSELESEVSRLQSALDSDENGGVLDKIQEDGLEIGNRWVIKQEGTALVFRDTVSSGDTRYAMLKGKKVNL